MWKRSAVWSFLILFLLTLGAWLLYEVNHSMIWPILGLLVGLVLILGILIAERCKMKWIADILVLIFASVFIITLLLSSSFPELYGCVAGMLSPIVATLLIYQIYKKRIVTWDEIIDARAELWTSK